MNKKRDTCQVCMARTYAFMRATWWWSPPWLINGHDYLVDLSCDSPHGLPKSTKHTHTHTILSSTMLLRTCAPKKERKREKWRERNSEGKKRESKIERERKKDRGR